MYPEGDETRRGEARRVAMFWRRVWGCRCEPTL